MTQVSQLITDAFREDNLIPIGATPNANEQAEALARFNAYLLGVFGQEMGENLQDWPVPLPQRTAPVSANFPQLPYPAASDPMLLGTPFAQFSTAQVTPYPPKNSRLIFGNVTSTVYFPEAPDDGTRMAIAPGSGAGDGGQSGAVLTLDGNGRTIEGAATQTYTATGTPAVITARQWFYRADLGDWKAVVPLVLTDECPFPQEFDDLWVCFLSIRLAPRFGKQASNETIAAAKGMLSKLKARYRQEVPTTYGSQDFPRSYQSYIGGQWFLS